MACALITVAISTNTASWRSSVYQFPFPNIHESAVVLSAPRTNIDMYSAGPSSPNFQLILSSALKAYEKQTKNDPITHPLAAQLQACQSPNSILVILQQQVQGPNRSRASDDRLTKWLDPTVNVLYAFSKTLESVSLVCLRNELVDLCKLLLVRYFRPQQRSLLVSVSSFQCVS